jgi:DNA replication protein DnaC
LHRRLTLADAILDRLIHHAHRLVLSGESMRKKRQSRRDDDGKN